MQLFPLSVNVILKQFRSDLFFGTKEKVLDAEVKHHQQLKEKGEA